MVGTRFDYQYSPFGQKAGISLYPVSGVIDGAKLSLNGTGYTAGTGNALVTISAGKIKLDGVAIELPTINATLATSATNLSEDSLVIKVYIHPKRLVPALTSAPAVGDEGDKYIKVARTDDYYIADTIYKVSNDTWVAINPYTDIPISQSHNMFPLNDIIATGYSAGDIKLEPEITVFHKTGVPPHVNAPGNAMLRQSASIMLGEITYSGGNATITKGLPDYNLLTI